MSEKSLQLRLEGTNQRSGQYILTFESSLYPVMLNPEAHFTISDWLRRLRSVLAGQNDPAGSSNPHDLLQNVGTWLWQALLPERAPVQDRAALAQALRTGRSPLLLELPDTLAGLPWELLYDPERSGEGGFLARHRPLLRLAASTAEVKPIEAPLRVLLLISSPPGLGEDSRIDEERERSAVELAVHHMRETGGIHLLVEDIVTPKRAQQALMRFKPHIVHYIGHGEYDEASRGVLLWEDEQGNELQLSTERLVDLLRPRDLLAVVLHGCQTGRSNARTEVRSIAGTLVNVGLLF